MTVGEKNWKENIEHVNQIQHLVCTVREAQLPFVPYLQYCVCLVTCLNKVKVITLPGALHQLGAIRFLILWPEPSLEAAASGIGF